MKRTVELLLPEWTAAIPADWDFEIKFAPADTEFTPWAGLKFRALKGSQMRGSGHVVEGLFDGLIGAGWAVEVEAVERGDS